MDKSEESGLKWDFVRTGYRTNLRLFWVKWELMGVGKIFIVWESIR